MCICRRLWTGVVFVHSRGEKGVSGVFIAAAGGRGARMAAAARGWEKGSGNKTRARNTRPGSPDGLCGMERSREHGDSFWHRCWPAYEVKR